MSERTDHVTQVLYAAARGQRDAAARLLPLVYDELKALARARMARLPAGNTLQPTALVHEAYMRVIGARGEHAAADPGWDGRGHFFAAAARAMRDILVDQARRKGAVKAGGDRKRQILDHVDADQTPAFSAPASLEADEPDDLLALDAALARLEAQDQRKAEVVMLKYFAGLEHEQIAAALSISVPTVERDWRFARSWLQKELRQSGRPA